MIVMKFGGTSIEDQASIENVVKVVEKRLSQRPICVFSAMGKTTDQLLSAAQYAGSGKIENALAQLVEIQREHFVLGEKVIPQFETSRWCVQIRGFFQDLFKLIEGLSLLKEFSGRSQDKILSYGELISSTMMEGVLASHGLDVVWLDARDLMITDDRFTQASPLWEESEKRIQNMILPLVEKGKVPIIQGYIGSTSAGQTTTLGFEGSDFTASLIGAAVQASDIQIWKTVSGLMTTDPSMYSGAKSVPWVSYDEAAALTFLGAKVLHRKAIYPAQKNSIPMHIYNVRDPDFEGTRVGRYQGDESITGLGDSGARGSVTSITYQRNIRLLKITPPTSAVQGPFLKELFDVLHREKLSPEFTSSTHGGVILVFHQKEIQPSLLEAVKHLGESSFENGKATVSLVGHGLAKDTRLTEKTSKALEGIPTHLTLQGVSPYQITFLVDEDRVDECVLRLHQGFVEA